jgi:hypothetical protein
MRDELGIARTRDELSTRVDDGRMHAVPRLDHGSTSAHDVEVERLHA